jgi:predicted phage-related endonuclease
MSEPAREQWQITGIGEWLERRRHHITASRIAALFGLHPFLSLDGLVAELLGQSGEVPNSSMRDGHILEAGFPYAVKADGKPWDLVKADTYHWLPEHRLGATPDFWIGGDGLLQAKTASVEQWEKWRGTIPVAYTLQTLTEMLVTGRSWGVLACMIRKPAHPIHYFDVPRHPAAEARILDAVAEFWKRWDAGEHPQPQTAVGLAELVSDGSHRDFSGDNEMLSLLTERAELVPVRRDAEKRLDEIDGAIKERLGPASTAWCPGWSLTFKPQTRKETVLPERTFRVLRVRAVDEQESTDAAE